MTDIEWLKDRVEQSKEKEKRERERKEPHKEQAPERPVTGTFWTHQYKDHS
jgi:hypothetical protein